MKEEPCVGYDAYSLLSAIEALEARRREELVPIINDLIESANRFSNVLRGLEELVKQNRRECEARQRSH